MTTTDLAGLIAKLEAATEDSKSLFVECYVAVFGSPAQCLPYEEVTRWSRFTTLLNAGAFLDAALTLVPEGFYLDLHDWRWSEEPRWHASLQNVTGLPVRASAKATTAPLALCIAALKARSQS